ncbi:membrane-associated lipoprotein involved in thiamine biosynthesis [Candidatus Moduliflexus flocculans]|uniref:FAD:protein FMN transferase n=1 Tax=Candidatus Moduliflexus flocculans TaxID=1499966 RepID=A0A0S6W5N8_9BACT|nr:membrane-associated lipoprotein involved in thiamine biosynthesis [Candidatus Moduliflexus flocculans]
MTLFLFSLVLLFGMGRYYYLHAQPRSEAFAQSRLLLDTVVDIQVLSSDEQRANQAIAAAYAEMQRIEGVFSRYQEGSQIFSLNKNAGIESVAVSSEVRDMLQRAKEYGLLTDGLFNVTIGALVDLWGIGTEHERVPSENEIRQTLPRINLAALELDQTQNVSITQPGGSVDLGGIGKGYAIDRAWQTLKDQGIEKALINAGGNIRCLGTRADGKPWRIGIRHPRQEGILGVIEVTEKAVATSGDYERYFVKDGMRYHHILDPRTGKPAQGCQSVTILAPTAEMADMLSTAVFIMGADAGMRFIEAQRDVEAMIVGTDGTPVFSAGFVLSAK